MEKIKPKNVKPLLYAPLKLILDDAKECNRILQAITPTICNIINQRNEDYIRQSITNSNNNNYNASGAERRYFDVDKTGDDRSAGDDTQQTFDRSRVRNMIINEIMLAPSSELKHKWTVELNKLDDNYTHAQKDIDIKVELIEYKVPKDCYKYLADKGLCAANAIDSG